MNLTLLTYYKIIENYFKLSGIPIIVNTSFNLHEEPIVCTPNDAIRAFKQKAVDVLAIKLLGRIKLRNIFFQIVTNHFIYYVINVIFTNNSFRAKLESPLRLSTSAGLKYFLSTLIII